MAQGIDYENCAKILETSIKKCMPDSSVTIVTTDMLPYGDQAPNTFWKLQNDWQVYEASPYEYTIKLEADMIIPQSIDYYWDLCKHRDIVVCSTIRDYKNEVSNVKAYRQFTQDNNLPDVYNAITYFRKSEKAKQFFELIRNIFENWEQWKSILICNKDEICTTDWAYSIACKYMGIDNTTLPNDSISMVHMKKYINNLITEDWTKELICEYEPFRVNSNVQRYPFHYHIKRFSETLNGKI